MLRWLTTPKIIYQIPLFFIYILTCHNTVKTINGEHHAIIYPHFSNFSALLNIQLNIRFKGIIWKSIHFLFVWTEWYFHFKNVASASKRIFFLACATWLRSDISIWLHAAGCFPARAGGWILTQGVRSHPVCHDVPSVENHVGHEEQGEVLQFPQLHLPPHGEDPKEGNNIKFVVLCN